MRWIASTVPCSGKAGSLGDSKLDCACELVLTELYLYVLEDNYNNTYTEHYTIPIKN